MTKGWIHSTCLNMFKRNLHVHSCISTQSIVQYGAEIMELLKIITVSQKVPYCLLWRNASRSELYAAMHIYGGWFAPRVRHSVRMTYRPSAALRLLGNLEYPTTNSCQPINKSLSLPSVHLHRPIHISLCCVTKLLHQQWLQHICVMKGTCWVTRICSEKQFGMRLIITWHKWSTWRGDVRTSLIAHITWMTYITWRRRLHHISY